MHHSLLLLEGGLPLHKMGEEGGREGGRGEEEGGREGGKRGEVREGGRKVAISSHCPTVSVMFVSTKQINFDLSGCSKCGTFKCAML